MKNSSDKKDRLERFVRDNRDGFDAFLPKDDLWNRIDSKLHNDAPPLPLIKKNGKWWHLETRMLFDWRVAASIVLVLGIGYLFFLNREYGVTRDPGVALKVPAYAREFNQYTNTIEQKRVELIKLTKNNPELYKDFSTDLQSLEKSYTNLRSNLSDAPNQEALLKAMVQNLQWQIELLNQQLNILQRINKEQNDQNENSDNAPVI